LSTLVFTYSNTSNSRIPQ